MEIKKKKKRKVRRSIRSGKWVNKKAVEENPNEIVTEVVKKEEDCQW